MSLGRTRRSANKDEDDDNKTGSKERLRADREARLQRRKDLKEFGPIGHKRDRGDHRERQTVKKRRRIDDSEDEFDDEEEGESEMSEIDPDKGIELSGKLNLVYEEHGHTDNRIDKVKMVLKGLWKLASSKEEDSQNLFLYQKIGIPLEEELIEEYFCEDMSLRLALSSEHYTQANSGQQ